MNFWVKNLIALVLGLGSCAGSYYLGKSSLDKFLHWENTVADISSSNDIKRTATFTYEGNSYTIYVGNGLSKDNNTRKAVVIFPKEDPAQGEVRNKATLYVLPLVLGLFGFVMIAVAFFSVRHKLSGRPTADPNDPEIIAQKEQMKQNVLEMKDKMEEMRNKFR